jgi:O-antigen/teichoic acid export membrane protein
MLYFDRFLIAGILTLTAVTYYVTPYEVLSRVQVIPHSLFGVLFPAFASAYSVQSSRFSELYRQSTKLLTATMLPLMAVLFLLAPELLWLWLGQEFSEASSNVARWLSIGWFHVMIARTHSVLLQSTGRPDLLAKAHFAELFPYGLLLWLLTKEYGIDGTAIAWFLRGLSDAIILAVLVRATVPTLKNRVIRYLLVLPASWALFAVLTTVDRLEIKMVLAVILSASGIALIARPVRMLLSLKN